MSCIYPNSVLELCARSSSATTTWSRLNRTSTHPVLLKLTLFLCFVKGHPGSSTLIPNELKSLSGRNDLYKRLYCCTKSVSASCSISIKFLYRCQDEEFNFQWVPLILKLWLSSRAALWFTEYHARCFLRCTCLSELKRLSLTAMCLVDMCYTANTHKRKPIRVQCG